jgi:hypothetical protein
MELMPDTKIKADGGLAEGTLYLPKPGHIEVKFDNSYSIFRYSVAQLHAAHPHICNVHQPRKLSA